jgi:hypothetical protein
MVCFSFLWKQFIIQFFYFVYMFLEIKWYLWYHVCVCVSVCCENFLFVIIGWNVLSGALEEKGILPTRYTM